MKNKYLLSPRTPKIVATFSFVGLVTSLSLSACNSDSSVGDAVNSAQEAAETAPLQHTFAAQQCSGGAMKLAGTSSRVEYAFSGNKVAKTVQVFSDSNCQSIAATVVYNGEFEKKDSVAPNVNQIDITYKTVAVEANDQAGQNVLNTTKFCDQNNWQLNQPVDMTGAARDTFCPLDAMPKVSYDIYSVENNTLFLGNGDNKDAPGNRPSQLDRTSPYGRI
jgi:hypothetical protein